jgi:hypothetical protein
VNKKVIAAVAVSAALLVAADDPQLWTIEPPAPGYDPGPYDSEQQAIQQAQQQENQTGQYTWIHDQNGQLP